MKKLSYLALLVLLWVAGCETPNYYLNPALDTWSREKVEQMSPIKLPDHWNTESFKKIVLGVHITTGGKELSQTLNARLQTELSKLKRFHVYSAYNVNGKMMFLDLADIGEAEIKEPVKQPTINYMLNVKLSVKRGERMRADKGEKYFVYNASCDWSLEDLAERTVVESGVAKGKTERLQFVSPGLLPMSGFFPEWGDEEAVGSAAMKAIAVVANRIGTRMPVGGEITGVSDSGERLTLNKGYVDGIGKFHQVAICARVGKSGKMLLPIALAEAMPAVNDSNLHIYKWNTGNADTAMLVREYRSDKKNSARAFMKKYKLCAIGYGVPVPPEWEKDSTEADERLRLKR